MPRQASPCTQPPGPNTDTSQLAHPKLCMNTPRQRARDSSRSWCSGAAGEERRGLQLFTPQSGRNTGLATDTRTRASGRVQPHTSCFTEGLVLGLPPPSVCSRRGGARQPGGKERGEATCVGKQQNQEGEETVTISGKRRKEALGDRRAGCRERGTRTHPKTKDFTEAITSSKGQQIPGLHSPYFQTQFLFRVQLPELPTHRK